MMLPLTRGNQSQVPFMARKKSAKDRLLKIPVQAYLEPEQAQALKELSDQTRVPQQVYLREAVDLMLKHYQHVSELIAGRASEPPRPPPVLERVLMAAESARKGKAAAAAPAKHK